MKRFLTILGIVCCNLVAALAADVTFKPVLDVCFRTATGNTAWNSGYPKDAATEGNVTFESNYYAGIFTLQKYIVADLQNATSLKLTITVNEGGSGVDGTWLWLYPDNAWTAESGVDDIVSKVTTLVGIAPRATEGDVNMPLVKGAKVAGSDPAQGCFTISGAALASLKAAADDDGTFTVMITNNKLLETNNSRKYRSSNSANAEALRPTLVATIETPTVVNKTTGIGYATLRDAFAAAVEADADAELEVSDDQVLMQRLTWNKAHTLTITPTRDITITGHSNQMWFLANVNDAVLNIGSTAHTITLDGQGNSMGYDVTKYENSAAIALTNVTFENFDLNNAGHLVGSKANEGLITLENVTMRNCTNPADAYINKVRVTNDRLVLKGYLNIEASCPATAIYCASETKASGTTGRIKVDDPAFTASRPITIEWPGTKEEGIVVVIGTKAENAASFQLTDSEWALERKTNGDLIMAVPAQPTVRIGSNNYADLAAALDAAQDGETITLLADQEVSARVNVKNRSITIDGQGQYAIRRATGYTSGLLFLTQKPDEEMTTALTLQNLVLDGAAVETSAALIEAGNNGTTTLKDVTVKNVTTTADAVVVNKTGGRLTLDGVSFDGCTAAKADVFVGTNNVTLKGAIAIATIYVEKQLTLAVADGFAVSTPVRLITEAATREYGLLVSGGTASQFACDDFRLSQQGSDVFAMMPSVSATYAHPALLHSAADIAAAKARLMQEPYASAYAQLEAANAGTAAGAVEWLKRMDKNNWESTYADYNNYSRAATDARLAYHLALRWQLKGSEAAAAAAVAILNNWASTCKGFLRLDGYANSIPDPNEYLMTIQAYQFANAAELLRDYSGWQAADFAAFKTWMRDTFADVAFLFLENHHKNANSLHYWLNWDLAALNAMLAVGILNDDRSLVDYALAYTTSGEGTGNVANAIVATHQDPDSDEMLAQCQESGRDQGHATLDVTLLGVLCQTAQNIGTDLFTPYKALEMAEYVGKYNLKDASGAFVYDGVPFTEYSNGEVTHTAISDNGRGSVRPSWELFHAYAKKHSKADAYTEAWVIYERDRNAWGEGKAGGTDELGFGTLMFGAEVVRPVITVTVVSATREYGTENPVFTFEVSGGSASDLGGTPALSCEATAVSSVGEYAIHAAAGTTTYPNIVFVDATLNVTKAPLTISGGTYSMAQGDELPAFTAIYEGFRNGETADVLTTQPTLTTTVTPQSQPGEYEVTVSGAEAANYEISYQSGTLVIEAKPYDCIAGIIEASAQGGAVYDLNGRRVADTAARLTSLPKGIYIVGGRKVVKR